MRKITAIVALVLVFSVCVAVCSSLAMISSGFTIDGQTAADPLKAVEALNLQYNIDMTLSSDKISEDGVYISFPTFFAPTIDLAADPLPLTGYTLSTLSGATEAAKQASLQTLLEIERLKEQGATAILPTVQPPAAPDASDNGSLNVFESLKSAYSMITAEEISNIIKNNKYSSSEITIHQSQKNDIPEDTSDLFKAINKRGYRCSFLAVRLSDGASIGYNVDASYRCMSTIKAPMALYAYKQFEAENADPDEKMKYVKSYYYGGSGIIKRAAYGTKYTLKQLVSYSLLYSDNIAYIMLRDFFGGDGISNMLQAMGCTYYKEARNNWPDVSARDAALWWNEINKYTMTSTLGTSLLKTFIGATGNVLSKGVNYKYDVAHKSGSGSGYHHDCGIVMAEEPYLLILYTYNPSRNDNNISYMTPIIAEIDELINR